MVIQRATAYFGRHEAPQPGDIGENDPRRGSSHLLGMLGFRYLDTFEGFAASEQPLLAGEGCYHRITPDQNLPYEEPCSEMYKLSHAEWMTCDTRRDRTRKKDMWENYTRHVFSYPLRFCTTGRLRRLGAQVIEKEA